MLRKGYVEEQVEALGLAIARLLGLKERGRPEEALTAVRAAGKELTGLDLERVALLPETGVMALFAGGGGRVDGPKAAAAGALIAEMTDLLAAQGLAENPQIIQMRERALLLLSAALAQEPEVRTPDLLRRTAALITAPAPAERSELMRRSLAAFLYTLRPSAAPPPTSPLA